MIQFTTNKEGRLYVEEWCVSPTVYLDHWAWVKISRSETLATRFSSALKARGGTLAFSWLNLVEFSKVTDELQTREADILLDTISPYAFVLNPNFFNVMNAEDKLLAGEEPTAPHADLVTLRLFVNLSDQHSLKPFPPQNLFRHVPATGMANAFDSFADLVIEKVTAFRQEHDGDKSFRKRVKQLPTGKYIQRGTRCIASELIGNLLVDKGSRFDRSDAVDLCHAIVPVAYCDYVLLDARWTAMVERAQGRIRDGGLVFQTAKAITEKDNGLERFLQELESSRTGSVS